MSPRRAATGNRIARLVAPVVFLAAVTVAVLIVRSGLSVDDASTSPATALETRATTTAPTRTRRVTPQRTGTTPARDRQLYAIEAGDTLETIAAERETTVERLLTLNPGLDPVALRIGQRIRVE